MTYAERGDQICLISRLSLFSKFSFSLSPYRGLLGYGQLFCSVNVPSIPYIMHYTKTSQFAFLGTKLQYLADFEASLGDHGYSACSLYLIHVFLNAWNGGGNKCVWGWCFGEHGCHDSGRTKSNKLVLQPTVYCEHNMHVEVEIHFQLVTGHDFSLCECFHCGFAVWHLSLASPSGFHVRFVPCFFFFFWSTAQSRLGHFPCQRTEFGSAAFSTIWVWEPFFGGKGVHIGIACQGSSLV